MTEVQARNVRVGVVTTFLVVVTLAVYRVVPGHRPVDLRAYWSLLAVATVGAAAVLVLPWARLFTSWRGNALLYAWSVVDVALISALVAVTGWGDSPMWGLYLLTTVFFAASYPQVAQPLLLAFTVLGYTVTALIVADHAAGAAEVVLRSALIVAVWVLTSSLARELRREAEGHERARADAAARSAALLDSLTALEEAQEQLVERERLAAVGEMAATVAHELHNPIGVVTNVLYLLEQRFGDLPDARRMLDTVSREVATATRVVSDLLEYTRPRPLITGTCHLDRLTTITLETLPPPAGVEVRLHLDDDLPPVVGDQDKLGHVLRTLLTGAYDALPQGGQVDVRVEHLEATVRVTVRDNGAGMDEATVAALLQPFSGQSSLSAPAGLGLGLVVADRIVRAHLGALAVTSRVDEGTSVSVTLPCAPADLPLPRAADADGSPLQRTGPAGDAP